MTKLFVMVPGISLSTGILAAVLLAVSPLVNRRYAAKWRFWIWVVLALRLLIPLSGISQRSSSVSEWARAPVNYQTDQSSTSDSEKNVEPTPARVIEFTIPEQLIEPIPVEGPKAEKARLNVAPLGVLSAVWAVVAVAVFSVSDIRVRKL